MASPSIDEILASAKPREAEARILLDQELLDRHAEADAAQVEAAQGKNAELAVELAKKVGAIEDEIEAAQVSFRFAGIGYRRWMDLLRDHPPTKKHPNTDHNPDTFPVAAIAASCVEPEMTVEQAESLMAALNVEQWTALWNTCLMVNKGGDQSPKSLGAGVLRRLNDGLGPQRTTSKSRAPSSSDE